MPRLILLTLYFLILSNVAQCVKILGVFPSPGFSQFILAEKLMVELAARGHEVTVISPYRPTTEPENYQTISIKEIVPFFKDDNLFPFETAGVFSNVINTYKLGFFLTEFTLKHKEVQKLLHSEEIFDLVIVEQFYDEALMGFAQHFKTPLIIFSSIGPSECTNHLMGNPTLPSISQISFTEYANHMKFFQRIGNLGVTIFEHIYKHFVAYPKHQEFLKKFFPEPIELNEVIYNASLMLLNSHATTTGNSAVVTGMIEIGGFHIAENPLSPELQDLLNKAKEGVIYFSLGTNLRTSDLSEEKIQAILSVFSKLKQKVLWKNDRVIKDKPENVFVSKWFNQSDVLAHPNVKLFITHGGLLSTTEAVFHGVPLMGMPIFGDQKMNMARASRQGFAKILHLRDLTEQTFFEAINETINDPRYGETSRKLSNIMRDRIVRPLDLAVYWIEYVIRHKGLHFHPPALDLYWYQYYMLDVASFVTFTLLLLLCLLKYCFSKLTQKPESSLEKNAGKKSKKHKQK